MTLALAYTRYKYSLKKPIRVFDQLLYEREGLYLHIITADGNEGVSDTAPLPGLSNETLADVISILDLNPTLPYSISSLDDLFSTSPTPSHFPNVLQFAIDMALLVCFSNSKTLSLRDFLGIQSTSLRCNGLVQGTIDNMKQAVNQLVKQGYDTIKLKVGRRSLQEDIDFFNDMNSSYPHIQWRLDANQTWSLNEAISFTKQVHTDKIEYMEDPCASDEDYEQFYVHTGLPYAMDIHAPIPISSKPGLKAIIIKPTQFGRLSLLHGFIQTCKSEGLDIIFSSSYESPLGLQHIAHLAAYFSPDKCHGLSTSDIFAGEEISPPIMPLVSEHEMISHYD